MMSQIKVLSLATYHIWIAEFGEFLIEIYALILNMGFQQQLVYLSPSWLVN